MDSTPKVVDTITHGITGALVARAFFSEREGRWATLAVTLGAVFPDSDTFANLFSSNNLARLELHRGITHSLVALPLFALLLGALTCVWTRQRKWVLVSSFFGLGIALHIFLDLLTSFGTMIWAPLSKARVSWDLTFIIDLAFTSIVLLPQLTAWVYSDRQRAWQKGVGVWLCLTAAGLAASEVAMSLRMPLSIQTVAIASLLIGILLWLPWAAGCGFRWPASLYCQIGVAALTLYLGACAVAHQRALARVERFAKQSGLAVEHMAALPSPPSPWRWSGLIQTPDGVYRIALDLSEPRPLASHFFAHAQKNRYLETAENLAAVKTYRWFARFPWVTYRQDNGLHLVEYTDLQFYRASSGNNPPFTFRVFFDAQGRLVRSGLVGP